MARFNNISGGFVDTASYTEHLNNSEENVASRKADKAREDRLDKEIANVRPSGAPQSNLKGRVMPTPMKFAVGNEKFATKEDAQKHLETLRAQLNYLDDQEEDYPSVSPLSKTDSSEEKRAKVVWEEGMFSSEVDSSDEYQIQDTVSARLREEGFKSTEQAEWAKPENVIARANARANASAERTADFMKKIGIGLLIAGGLAAALGIVVATGGLKHGVRLNFSTGMEVAGGLFAGGAGAALVATRNDKKHRIQKKIEEAEAKAKAEAEAEAAKVKAEADAKTQKTEGLKQILKGAIKNKLLRKETQKDGSSVYLAGDIKFKGEKIGREFVWTHVDSDTVVLTKQRKVKEARKS